MFSINSYAMSASEADSLANKFLVTQNKGKTTFDEIAHSIGSVSPTAAAAGVSVDELLSGVASLTANGIATSEAMTSLKAALSNVITPSASAAKAAEEMGLDFSAAALKSKGLSQFLKDIKTATNGDTAAMSSLFGSVEALNAMLVLTGNGAELFDDTLQQMTSDTSALENAYKTMSGSLDTSLSKLKNSAKILGTEFYESISEPLTDVTDLAASYVQRLSDAFSGNGITGLSRAVGGVLGEAIGTAAEYLPDAVKIGSDVIVSLAEGINQNLPDIMQAGQSIFTSLIGTLESLSPTLADTSETILTSLADFLTDNTEQVANSAVNIITALAGGIGKALPKLLPAAVDCIITLADALVNNLDEILYCAEDIITALCNGLVKAGTIFVTKAPEILLNLAGALIAAVPTVLIDVPTAIVTAISDGLLGTSWDDTANSSVSSIADSYNSAVESLTNSFTRAGERIHEFMALRAADPSEYMGMDKKQLENIIADTNSQIDRYKLAMDELSSVGYDPTQLSGSTYKALSDEFGADRMAEIDLLLDKNIQQLKADRNNMLVAYHDLFLAPEQAEEATNQASGSKNIADYYNKNGKANEDALQNFLDGEKRLTEETAASGNTAASSLEAASEKVDEEFESFYDDLEYQLARDLIDESGFTEALRAKLESSEKYNSALYTRYWKTVSDADASAAAEAARKAQETADEAANAAKERADANRKILDSAISEAESLSNSLNKSDAFQVNTETDRRSGDTTKSYGITDYGKKVEARKKLLEKVESLAEKGVPKAMLKELIGLDPEEALQFANQLDRLGADGLNGITADYKEYESLGNDLSAAVTTASYDDFTKTGENFADAVAEGINANSKAIEEALINSCPDLTQLIDTAVSSKQSGMAKAVTSSAVSQINSGESSESRTSGKRSTENNMLKATIPIDISLIMDGKEFARVVTKQQKNITIEEGK